MIFTIFHNGYKNKIVDLLSSAETNCNQYITVKNWKRVKRTLADLKTLALKLQV